MYVILLQGGLWYCSFLAHFFIIGNEMGHIALTYELKVGYNYISPLSALFLVMSRPSSQLQPRSRDGF